jgi:hypothetical protein
MASIHDRIRRRRIANVAGAAVLVLVAVLGTAVAALGTAPPLAEPGTPAQAGPWTPFPDGGWAYVRVNDDGRRLFLGVQAIPTGRTCAAPPAVPVHQDADRVVVEPPTLECMYQVPIGLTEPLGDRPVVLPDGTQLPVLLDRIVPRPTYPAGLRPDATVFPVGQYIGEPQYVTEYVRADGYRVSIFATPHDLWDARSSRQVTVDGHEIAIEPVWPPTPGLPGPRNMRTARWIDHGWAVAITVTSGSEPSDGAELERVLNGLVWPT